MLYSSFIDSKAVWYALGDFETRDLTSRYYRAQHGRELSADRARQIASNFIQAREYFRSAAVADRVVRPLLQYYGVSVLSRGLVLFLNREKQEESLKSSHGLVGDEWQSTLSGGLVKIGDLRVRLTKGIFHDLLVATNNVFPFRVESSATANWRPRAWMPPLDTEFRFRDIASRIADVSEQYGAWTGALEPFVTLKKWKIDEEGKQFEFVVVADPDTDIKAIFTEDRSYFRKLWIGGMRKAAYPFV